MVIATTDSERDWRRVMVESHALWCDCDEWQSHLYRVFDSDFHRRARNREERRAANWRRQMRRLHRLWCFCRDWKSHALFTIWDGMESDADSSASSSGEAPEQPVCKWKNARALSRAYHYRRSRGRRGTPPPRNMPGFEHVRPLWYNNPRDVREDERRTRAEPDRVVFQLGGVHPRRPFRIYEPPDPEEEEQGA
ncbi:protein US32 [Panine betaherpesvirus 2]|uniref:Protein US32 n=1 Tax=Panine betaherpesvirus 2 TaxID=188763 RepID=Q8QRS8_9BETA|nr:protein US32 [Panine betaherpesvirus 2]AAM00810.1 protein US32 [Panine betaherpesvirus 2]